MKYMNKYLYIISLIAICIFSITGCSGNNQSNTVNTKQTGNLYLEISLPDKSDKSIQSITDQITLNKMIIKITKGDIKLNKEVNISSDTITASFSELEVGEWSIEVTAIDCEGYDVYSGCKNVLVENNTDNQDHIDMTLLAGDLSLIINFPSDHNITSAKAILLPAEEDINQNMVIESDQATTLFSQIDANEWHLEIELYDSEEKLTIVERDIYVLPGRVNETIFNLNGDLILYADWETAPHAPTGLNIEENNGNALLSWQSNQEDNIIGYAVFRSKSEGGVKTLLTTDVITSTSYTDSSLESGINYYYYLKSYNENGLSSDFSSSVSFKLTEKNIISKYTFKSNENKTITILDLEKGKNAFIGLTPMIMEKDNQINYNGTIEINALNYVSSTYDNNIKNINCSNSQLKADKIARKWEENFIVPDNYKQKLNAMEGGQYYTIGDTKTFDVYNFDNGSYDQVSAELKEVSDYCYIFVDNNCFVSPIKLRKYAQEFSQNIFPTDINYFSTHEYSNSYFDYDQNGKCIILFTELDVFQDDGTIMGYFSSLNYYDPAKYQYSNGTDMFYINSYATNNFEDSYVLSTFAHEFQHLLFFGEKKFYANRSCNDIWLNEGFSGLAEYLNGYYSYNCDDRIYCDHENYGYFNNPDQESLLCWDGQLSDYGASNLFALYAYERFGKQFIKDIITGQLDPVEVITNKYLNFNDLYLDWIATNIAYDGNISGYTYPVDLTVKPASEYLLDSDSYSIRDSGQKYYIVEGNDSDVQLNLNISESTGVIIYREQ